ncbi:hypothetical protein BC938DRAFT_478998 [Jimgerdemannia flammicorona]|nr:hypothetical protein BC938DRAFT_478998 [Jimgerdemannia flammicorona]
MRLKSLLASNGGSYYYIQSKWDPTPFDYSSAVNSRFAQCLAPLHKGYVKPDDYLSFLGGDSLTSTLRRVVLESAGYGIVVECQRASEDFPLSSAIDSPHDHVG